LGCILRPCLFHDVFWRPRYAKPFPIIAALATKVETSNGFKALTITRVNNWEWFGIAGSPENIMK